MEAMRCTECGDVRWSFRGLTANLHNECELCGAPMKPERRQPHRGPETLHDERRDLAPAGRGASDDRPAAS